MDVKVLGPGCAKCGKLYEEAARAVAACAVGEVELTKVERIDEIAAFGVMMTPALVINGEVKIQGRLPKTEQIEAWLLEAKEQG